MRPTLALVDDPSMALHACHQRHPERPERVEAARAAVDASPLSRVALAPRDATDDELARAHAPEHLEVLRALDGADEWVDADTYVVPGTARAARRAAGGALALVDALLDGDADYGLGLLRPPGHHAGRRRMHGFCLVNNVAVAAAHALTRGLDRVLVLDWDVHHGDGTEDIFRDEPRVCFVSLHQDGIFPGTGQADVRGEGEGFGYNVNIPLPAGSGDADYLAAFDRVVLPIVSDYAPQLVLVSAGFDAHARDPLAGMELGDGGFGAMMAALRGALDQGGRGRLGLVLEGGYDLVGLEGSVRAVLGALAGEDTTIDRSTPLRVDRALARVIDQQRDRWPVG